MSSRAVSVINMYMRNCQYLPHIVSSLHAPYSCIETYGFGDFHCQKLYGLEPTSVLLTPENGKAASPPFEAGDGRLSSATRNNSVCIIIMVKDCMSKDVSNLAPG